jgi:hypothetical protein
MFAQLRENLKQKMHKYKKWEPLAFFTVGFLFDAMLLHRIDDPLMLVHQATYLTLAALIIAWDVFSEEGKGSVPGWLNWFWKFRVGILHFLLGTLLNVYTIFYFKSGSFLGSIYFLILLAMLLFLNEVRPAQLSKHFLRNCLFGLCLISYMNILVSIICGSVGPLVFFLAIAVAYLVHSAYMRFLSKRIDNKKLLRDIRIPFLIIAGIYGILYITKVLPPVPLSVKYIGIYHSVKKADDEYQLGYNRSKWLFWQSGDQTFNARPGEKVFVFAQVFSPARFKDQLYIQWRFHDPKTGWQDRDRLALNIVGGREEGFRGYGTKGNYEPGDWRVSIETKDEREVGRIGFEIVPTEANAEVGETRFDVH